MKNLTCIQNKIKTLFALDENLFPKEIDLEKEHIKRLSSEVFKLKMENEKLKEVNSKLSSVYIEQLDNDTRIKKLKIKDKKLRYLLKAKKEQREEVDKSYWRLKESSSKIERVAIWSLIVNFILLLALSPNLTDFISNKL